MSSYSFVVIKVEYNIIVQKYIMRIENIEYHEKGVINYPSKKSKSWSRNLEALRHALCPQCEVAKEWDRCIFSPIQECRACMQVLLE